MVWDDEYKKLMVWGKKEYDTDKLTGAMHRYGSATHSSRSAVLARTVFCVLVQAASVTCV